MRAGTRALGLLLTLALGCGGVGAEPGENPFSRYLEARATATGFSAAVRIGRDGEVPLRSAYGLAQRELGVPLTPDHVFRIGSVTKPITATGLLRLVEAGRLALDDPLCDYLAHCPAEWRPVTVRHLLSHTSGIPDLFGELPDAPVEQTRAEIDRLLAELGNARLESPAGEVYAYSNFNYMLLGYVMEVVSGRPWARQLEADLFAPLGMVHTAYDDVWAIVEGRVTGYSEEDGAVVNLEYDDHSAYAAGGLRSTVDDLDRWLAAFANGEILSPETVAEATRPFRSNYGYGWQVLELFGRRMYNHTGGLGGFTAHVAVYPDDGLRVIVLSNNDREDAKATACDLAALHFGHLPLPTGDAAWLERPRAERCRETGA